MPRRSAFELVLDASLFTPVQLQPVAVGRLGFQAGTRWLRDHVASHRTLVTEHKVGLVLWSWQLEYLEPLRFEDADQVDVEVTGRVRGPRASQLEVAMTVTGPAGVAVRTTAASVPLRLSGDRALSGAPARLPEDLLAGFPEDEVERSSHLSRVPGLTAALERADEPLGPPESLPVRIHRHHCEVADQWYWAESLGFAGSAREEYVRKHGRTSPVLRRALSGGLHRLDVTWLRAGQLWDDLVVRTTAHRHEDGLAFVHRLDPAEPDGGGSYAVVVEQI
ncbi:acyl-CoA thioesterase [Kitasatospora viridis]|uniref:Acyl-CoA thioesterase n=1 Tax=Kitasatospora viridis TaxID=281105 RepID=A0A561UC58_9ACTN|nr:acyl-CoA thioesterase [Kitasatospora viridis]TWF96945.1 hypothetical protein FHX73_11719 [Kitasatospora viridis]